ncbi:MAG: hypothetical protein DRQ61_07730 [Gammaproteobacteria bacterium]|nr:MAG: hypothetical protein DRQ61_07730 [Gammaproteobacteria bacterium]
MKVKLLSGCVVGTGKTGNKGQVVEVSDTLGRQLLGMGKAEKVSPKKAGKSD